MAHQCIDCKTLKCPVPIMEISKLLKSLESGDTVEIEATDPAFKKDLEAWVKKLGHEIISFSDGPVKRALIKKG